MYGCSISVLTQRKAKKLKAKQYREGKLRFPKRPLCERSMVDKFLALFRERLKQHHEMEFSFQF